MPKDGFTADPGKGSWWKPWMTFALLGAAALIISFGAWLDSR